MKHFYLVISLFLMPLISNAQIYVDRNASGSNDGTSWSNAYTDLQDAIQNAPLDTEVWVAEGIYFPSATGDVNVTFELTQSIKLFGGFQGTEAYLSERNIKANPTILSGDYNQDDEVLVSPGNNVSINFNNNGDNAKRILEVNWINASITIDGFTVSGGNGQEGTAMFFGPDLELNIAIVNCTIKENQSSGSAGAIRLKPNDYSVLNFRVENSSIFHNTAKSGGGKGGAVMSSGSGPLNAIYKNVLFHKNQVGRAGGAIYHHRFVNANFENCIFSHNQSNWAGAVNEETSENSVYRNCTFFKNRTAQSGTAIYSYFNGDTRESLIENCIFYDNGITPFTAAGSSVFAMKNSVIEFDDWASFVTALQSTPIDHGGMLYNLDPQFIDETNFDLNLTASSPMINAGDNASVQMDFDHTGTISRIIDGNVDLGACEFHLPLNAAVESTLCFGDNFGTALASGDNYPPFTFDWSDPSLQGANPTNLTAGNYEVTVSNAIGDTDTIEFSLFENPEIIYTSSSTNPTSGNADGTATVNVTNGTSPFTYSWSTDPIQTAATATDLTDGTYTVIITDANGCTTSTTVDVGTPSTVLSIDESNEITVGPNPFVDHVQINILGSLLDQSNLTQVKVYNTTGQLVHHRSLSSDSNNTIDLSQLSAGLYFMELQGKDLRFGKRLIKQ